VKWLNVSAVIYVTNYVSFPQINSRIVKLIQSCLKPERESEIYKQLKHCVLGDYLFALGIARGLKGEVQLVWTYLALTHKLVSGSSL